LRFEEDSFQIILFAGNANGLFQDAMEHAEAFDFNAAQECIDKGEKELVSAQDAHREILKHLADDEMIDCNVLLAHAFVFLHGLGGSTDQTKSSFTDVPNNVRMVYMDLRGNGKSEMGDISELSFQNMAKDVRDLCEYLGLSNIVIGGISMGAGVATRFCVNWPQYVKKLILIRIAWLDAKMDASVRGPMERLAKLLQSEDLELAKAIFMSEAYYQEMKDIYPYNVRSDIAAFDYYAARETAMKYVKMPADSPISDLSELECIAVPTMILANRKDPVHPYCYGEVYAQYIPNSKCYEIPSKNESFDGHYAQMNKFLREFLFI